MLDLLDDIVGCMGAHYLGKGLGTLAGVVAGAAGGYLLGDAVTASLSSEMIQNSVGIGMGAAGAGCAGYAGSKIGGRVGVYGYLLASHLGRRF